MQSAANHASPSPSPADSPNGGITIPPLNGVSHIRQKPSRVGLGERQYSYDITTGPSVRVMPRSNPSPPPVHTRQYSEGAVGEKVPTPTGVSGRNASISSLESSQFGTFNGLDSVTQNISGARRRHGHSHSHAIPHHHVPNPVSAKPASMMSIPKSFMADLGTSEYALHILFTNFVRIVEDMLKKVMAIPVDVDPDVPAYFGPGADPQFDKVLTSLGHIGSHKPTPVINTVMYWRKAKSDALADSTVTGGRSFTPTPANVPAGAVAAINAGITSNAAMMPLPPPSVRALTSTPPLLRRQTEPVNVVSSQSDSGSAPTHQTALGQQILRDRLQRCAIYILCRALIEVVKHTTADALTDDIASRIEDIVFRQLVKQDAEDFYRGGALKSASWNIFAELLGCFSNIRYHIFFGGLT